MDDRNDEWTDLKGGWYMLSGNGWTNGTMSLSIDGTFHIQIRIFTNFIRDNRVSLDANIIAYISGPQRFLNFHFVTFITFGVFSNPPPPRPHSSILYFYSIGGE